METMQYKITVIIPVYNVEQYIERCLQSVIHQTYSEPFECILIDDCSPDKSMNIVQNIVDNYHGHIVFNIIHHEQNGGLSAARNTGIHNSKGMYLLFVDSDDYIDKRCLELFDNQLSLHPGVTMVLGNAQNNRTNTIEICKELPQHCSNNQTIRYLFYHNILPVSAWNKLVLKDFILTHQLYFKEKLLFEDLNWSYYLFRILPSYVFVPQITYTYEDNPNSIMNNADRDFDIPALSYLYIFDDAIKNIDNDNYVDCCLFIAHFMFIVQDRINKSGLNQISYQQFLHLKRSLTKNILQHRKFILFLYSLLLLKPFSLLTNFKFYRHHHYQITNLVYKLSK